MRHLFYFTTILVCLSVNAVCAQSLYKSVNDQGEVTFSDSPPDNAAEIEEIEVQPGPTEAQRRESAERAKQIESLANDLGDSNAQREQQRNEARQQAQKQAQENEVQPVTGYNDGRGYPNRPIYPPVARPPLQPELPILPEAPGRPVQLPAGPVLGPGM
jgi:hypothetical protein